MKNNPFKKSEEFLYGQSGGAGRVIDVEAARQEAELPDFSADMGEDERQRKIEAVRKRRLNLARAAAEMVFSKDIDLMDDESRAGLYRASTKALFGFEDTDGRVAFGKKAGDMKSNLERLRLFLKGDVSQIEDEDVAAWRKLHGADEETRFRHADAHLKGKGSRDWDNGPSVVELAGAGMPGAQYGNFMQNAAAPTKDAATRKMRYETMNDEEKAAFRADTIARYERQIASANPLSMFLKTSAGISDEAAWTLAKCYQNGNVDVKDIEAIGDEREREKVLTALSMMRGDKKSGRLIGFIEQDFEDGTDFGNRLQMNIYGIQQAFAGLVTDVWDLGKAGIDELKIYAKGLKDTEEAREMRRRTDLEAQIAAALRQKLPDADSFMGALSQGVAENVHWIAPYVGPFSAINKGKAALKGVKALKGALALDEMGKAAKGVKAAVKGVAVAKSEAGLARQMAALELYTERLRELSATADAALKAMPEATQALAKTGVAAKGRAMIAAGRTAAFSSFANDYIETADAEGISRAESVPSAVFVGVINQAIERFNVPGLDRTITPAELKSLALRSAVEAFRHERGAGLRKWVADSVAIRAREMGRTVATEALTEEPLQQFTTQMALEVDKTIDGLKKEGKADLANVFGELWGKIGADGFGKAWRLYFDTVQESLPAAVGFGVTGVAMQRGGQMWRNRQERKISGDMSYDEGIVDVLQRERNVRKMMAAHWMKDGGKMEEARNAVNEMISSARAAYSNRKAGDDTVRLVANAAGVDRKTAEVLHDCLEIEESMALYSPRFRAEVNLADAVMDIDEKKLKAVLPEYVEGSFLADKEKGLYSARLNLPNGEEKTLVYRVGDMSQWIDEQIGEGGLADGGELADSYEARRREMPEGAMKPWSELSDAERRDIALQGTDGFLSGRAGVFEFGGADGQKVTVRADDVISLASGRIADVGYVGAQATGRTLRHETFHALWRFAKGTLSKEDIEALYSHFPDLDPAAASDRKLDERMAVEFERYASGNFVPMKVRGTLDRFAGWAMDKIGKLLDAVGVRRDGVADPVTGKAYTLSDFYDKVLKGELGSGELGVEKRLIAKDGASGSPELQPNDASSMNAPPGEVTEEELAAVRAREEAETRKAATETEKPVLEAEQPVSGTEKSVSGSSEGKIVYTAENPADASVPNARYYKIGLPNSDVKLVGRLEVRDAHTGLTTSTDEDYHDRGNQNRDDKSEESRALVMKIAGHPDPLQIGTVQPIANNGIVWILNNSNVIIGNHRVNGVRAGYEKGTAEDLEKFVREDAAKRGIEIGEGVKAPLTVFVLERIESPDGKADVHEVVRLANESQNRGFNIREQAGNDAKILIDNNLLPRMAFRPDGRIDETKSADAIGKFRQESGAQGLVGEDGMLTEEGQTRIQNAAVAALLSGTGNNALLGRIMDNAGRLDMASQLRALMKVAPELMSLAKTKPEFDIRDALAEALTLYTEWREKDEEKRSEKGKSRHDWRELDKEGKRKRGLSWEAYLSQGDMFRTPSEEAKILGDLFAKTEQLRSFDREDVESAAGKKRVVDLITDYLTDYIENARNVNTETEDMFGGTPASRAEVLAAQRARGENGARFSMSAPVERSKNLIALHNLKPSDLAAAAELEGMPAPSIAVVKDSMGHDDYGPISFVFGAGVIDPKADRNNKIYSSDAWTPTRGSVNIEYKVLDEKLDEIIASLINAGDENYRKLFKAFSERGSLGDIAENAIAAGEYYRLWHNDAILLSYLNSKGQSVPLSYREQAISHNYSNAVVKGVSDAVGDKIAEIWENGGKTGDEEAVERMSEIMRPAAVKAKDDENPEGAAERRAKGVPTLGERLYGEALKRPWDLAKAVMQYREHGITQEIDTFAVSKTMSEMLSTDDPAYQEWVRSTFAPAVGAKGIRNKRELFTPSGSRRSWEALHDEVTAQRIVDMMYHNSKEVGGNGFGGYNPEGAAVRTYASITEMRRDRDRLKVMPEEEWKKLHDEARKDMIDAVSRLQSKQKGFYSDNSFIELDTIKDIVLQAWIDAKGNKVKYLSICKDELHVYDEETCGDIWDVMMRLRNAPTKYFEAKPERVVGFDEVAFAVVPDDSSAETVDILKTRGIETHTYKAEDKEDRLRVLNEAANANNIRFSIGGFHGALATGKVGLLREADKMEKGGASREEIWRTTGWWRGKDGKWRVELPDIKMRSKREIELAVKYYGNSISLAELVIAPELFKAYPALEETRIILDNDYFLSSVAGSFNSSTKDITLNGKGQISLANLPYADRADYDSAIDKVSSDDHLNNWIEISKELGIEVGTFAEEREKAKSKIEEIEKRIVEKNRERLQSLDSDETRSILAHEIQHWIQENEGFAKGGNVKTIREARALNESLKKDIAKELNKAGYNKWLNRVSENVDTFLQTINDIREKHAGTIMPAERAFAETLDDEARTKVSQFLDKAEAIYKENAKDAHYGYTESEAYRSLLGEVEARNVQRRLDMSPEERAATPPWETESVPENRQIVRFSMSAELSEAVLKKVANEKYGIGSAARNGEGFVDLERGDTFKRIEKAVREKVHEQVENTNLGITATIGSNTNADHLVHKDSSFGDEDPEAHKYAVKNTLELFRKAKTGIVHHDKKGTKNDYIRAFTPFYFRDEVYLATITLRRDKDSDKFYSIEAVETERDAAPGVSNDASKMDSGDSPRSSRRTAQEAQSPESLKTGDSPRSSRRTAQEAQSPVSFEDKISYYVGNVNETEPKFVNSGENFSQEELLRRIRADISALRNTQFQPARRASMAFAYPNLAWMSNEELLSAAVAAKMALGKSDKVSDRNTTVNEVQRKLRAIHPDWDSSKVALEAQRIFGDARKLSKEIRGDIDKGVSDSLILEHLPQSMRTVFGEEMTGEARRGWRLGLFQAKAEAGVKRKVAEAQERLMRDALEIETGMMHGDIERGFGVDLAATLLKVKENDYLKVVPKSSGGEALAASGEVETMGESVAEDAFSFDETVEEVKPKVSALVQAIAKRAEAKAEEESAKRKANRERAENRVGNEDINDGKDAEPDTSDFAAGEISPEEVVEEAVKVGADLNNPLSFALFVMEMARVNWVKKHNLNPDAEPKHSLVYIQFQRKTLQDVYSTLARRVTYSRGRETVMNALQRLDKVTTMRGLIREAEFMGKLVGAKMIRESALAMCERLDNLLRTEFQTGRQFKPDEELLNRKVPAMLERQARYMRHAMWLTPDGVSEETRALLQEKALAGSEFDEHGADKSVSRVIDEADMKLKILADWGALKYKDLATVEAAVQWWLNAAEGGADAIAQAWDVREARTLKAAGVLAKAVRNPKRKTAVDGRSWTQTANEIFQGHFLFHHVLTDLTRFAGEEDRAAAMRYIDWLDLEIQKAGTRVASERIKMQDEMRKAVEQIYGRKFRDVVSELSALDGRFDAFMGAADDGVSVPGTKGRAMQLLVSLQQIGYAVEVEDEENPGQMKTVYMGGYYDNIVENGRVGQAEELLKLMSPADLNFIKWLRQWYERNRKGISDVSERIFGVGVMAELGNYMPVKMLLDPKGLENGAGATWQIFPKALTPRVRNRRDFDTSVDILTMWSSRLEESIQWKHHVELGIELRGIFGRSELQKAIRANHGAKVLSLVKGFITDILNGKGEKQEMMVNPWLDRARQFASLGGLGGNVGVMLKQITSIPAFGFEIGVWRTFRHLIGTLTPQGWADVRKVAQSEEFRNRWKDGYSEEVQNALSSENPGFLMRLWMASMITNKAGDCVPALLIGHGIYRDGIEQGLSERDAMARMWMIVERTQQSSRIENRTAFQRRNALGNAIYQFLSTQNQMLNYEVRALRDAVADPKNPKKWGKFVRDATLVHFVLSTFYYWMGELYKKMLGQEPSEDQLKDWVVSIIVGPVGALYGVGTTTVDAVESWVKGYSYGSSNAVPALNWLGQVVVRDPAILIHDIFNGKKSWDDVCDDMLRWLSDFNATFRDARKFYRFRIKEEKQKKRK